MTNASSTLDARRPASAADLGPDRPTSPVTARAVAFVAEHKRDAEALGLALADHIGDPDAFAATLRAGFGRLTDPAYLAGQHLVAPGLGLVHGVRWPLMAAIARGFRTATRRDPIAPLLYVADRLFREEHLEARWFAFGLLERTLPSDPERTWQLLRRAAREAGDWITVDDLAHPYAAGIVAEPYRWAELEQLVFSPSRWERRLVGSTIATMTHGARGKRLGPDIAAMALPILGQLIGDADPDVQKALAWAYRSLAQVDLDATTAALERETATAAATGDGHRAWVIRDSLAKLDPTTAARFRAALDGIRKHAGAPSTSPAAETAARFGELPDPVHHPEPPL
jgi:3-methyladenine DNA glycosylase AlkD